jgi:GTPase involved in cell partitioning and DNA repair
MGEAREKFASISGPQGGTALNGSQLKAEATAEMMQLIEDLKNFTDGSQPLMWVIG